MYMKYLLLIINPKGLVHKKWRAALHSTYFLVPATSLDISPKEKLRSELEMRIRDITIGDWSSSRLSLHSEFNSSAYVALTIQQKIYSSVKEFIISPSLLVEVGPLIDAPLICIPSP